ncbi:DUF4197 family protein [Altererythrobacter sp. ZODW24]|uniref:DUF4197 family protein n=1 Tax=Altererythrobacter sp. ZODW24 TaxID=2185142 RepID=UPI000DF7229F|nr:DUF4197 family protein [Altererythrobacter sp. ZODW24]
MTDLIQAASSRRKFIAGLGVGGIVLTLPACAGLPGFGLTDALSRLLLLSSERAFARLTADGGFWDQQVATVGLSNFLGARGNVLGDILTSSLFKRRLEGAFADVAVEGAERAAPIVADTVRTIGFRNAEALIRGGPTAATSFLRGEMGLSLVEAMVPELSDFMVATQDPLIGQALAALTGVNLSGAARNISTSVDDVIWGEIGKEEALIRQNPRSTNDPLIIGVFGTGL